MIKFLKRNYDIFAWSNSDIPGIDSKVTMHKLFTNLDHPPIHKKRRKFTLECLKVIEKGVAKLIKASVIRESHYSDWFSNVVIALKKGEK